MSIVKEVLLDLAARFILLVLGVLVSIVGFLSPSTCIEALAKVTITARERK